VNNLTVLSYSEIPEEQSVKIIATVAAELRGKPSTAGT
jgi:flagellar biosynthesis component FlhA